MSNTVLAGQSLLDKTIEMTGNVDNAFAVALANGVSVTDGLQVGAELSPSGAIKQNIVQLLAASATAVATEYSPKPGEETPEGIDFWAIGSTFKVS